MKFFLNGSTWLKNLSNFENSSVFNTTPEVFENYSPNDYLLSKAFIWCIFLAYIVFFILSMVGNGTVCMAIGSGFLKPTVTNFFMCNLAASDILVSVFCIPFTVLSNLIFMFWPFGSFLCPIISLIQLMTTLLRALTLVAMTCDRYYVLSRPFKARLNAKQAKLAIASIWIFSLTVCIPSAVFSKIIYLPYEPGSKGLCVEVWPDISLHQVYGIVIMLLQYFGPLLLMIITYSHIAVIVWRKRTPGEANRKRDERREKSKKKMMTMLVMTVINYFLCWLPYHVISIVGDVNPSIYDSKAVHALWIMAHLLSFSNSGTNAIIYYWRNKNFRIAYRNLRKGLKKGSLRKAENQRIPIRSMSSYRRNSRLSSTWSS